MTIFWDSRGPVHMDFADKANKLNGEYYTNVVEAARKKRRKPYGQTLFLLHDNAPIHKSAVAWTAVEQNDFVELSHPPYSPDLAPSDFSCLAALRNTKRDNFP
jgi:[histone H3]-lysine36 N-dimethyltransferase SETMAR